jgi:hypothetical protein
LPFLKSNRRAFPFDAYKKAKGFVARKAIQTPDLYASTPTRYGCLKVIAYNLGNLLAAVGA